MACTAFCNETVKFTYGLWLEAQLKISSLFLKYENIIRNQRIDFKYHSLPMDSFGHNNIRIPSV